MSKQVAIIGAGPGGLATAMLLAKAGASVTAYERGVRVGGRTSSIESDGFRFDLKREVPTTRLDPQYRLVFGAGGELLATPNVERMERAIAALSPQDTAARTREAVCPSSSNPRASPRDSWPTTSASPPHGSAPSRRPGWPRPRARFRRAGWIRRWRRINVLRDLAGRVQRHGRESEEQHGK